MTDARVTAPARVHVLLARDARVGVVLRRGPSKQVRLSVWNTAQDTFEHGQWLKGRVYEHRCDFSPSGDLLVYFGSKQMAEIPQWTAISQSTSICYGARVLSESDGMLGRRRSLSEQASFGS